ncbi:hypothetical protein EXS54_03180 [Patescibacteria group bacterium]|nr:hypothetical protein [Patescibacteria group bacterium]
MPTAFLTQELVEDTIDEMVPIIQEMIADGTTEDRSGLQIYVADLAEYLGAGNSKLANRFVGSSNRAAIFDRVAQSKLDISLRSVASYSYDVRLCVRETEDTRYYGSVVLGNIVVAASGFQAYYDEMVCGMLAYKIQAKMKEAAHQFEETEETWLP